MSESRKLVNSGENQVAGETMTRGKKNRMCHIMHSLQCRLSKLQAKECRSQLMPGRGRDGVGGRGGSSNALWQDSGRSRETGEAAVSSYRGVQLAGLW